MRLFIAVYEERSFTVAAARENSTQSGVSQHIRKLEQQLGSQLLTRSPGVIRPTPAGEAFYRGCIDVLRAFEQVRTSLRPFAVSLEGEVTLGLTPTMARCVLAPALACFVVAHPNVVVRVIEAYSSTITEKVRHGEVDIAIVPALQDDAGIRSHLIARSPEFLVVSRQAERRLESGNLRDIGPIKLVLPSRAHARRVLLDRYFTANDVIIQQTLEMDSMFGTMDFVAATDWVTILPGILLSGERDRSRFTITPLTCPDLILDIFRIEASRSTTSLAVEIFFEFLQTETDRLLAEIPLLAPAFGREELKIAKG